MDMVMKRKSYIGKTLQRFTPNTQGNIPLYKIEVYSKINSNSKFLDSFILDYIQHY